jgi:hypothetical protein
MPDRAYILARRNDLDGVNMQVTDLRPNTSQRNLIYEGPGQSGYLKYSYDQPGVTTVSGDSYGGGSLTTAPLLAPVDADTTGGGDDVEATVVAQFGLTAYLQERIEAGGLAAGTAPPTPAEALSMANAISALVEAGSALTLTTINAALAGVVASTELDSTGGSASFGAVEDVIRLLQGQAYRVRGLTIINDVGGVFQTLAQRQTFVDNQDSAATGLVFYAEGEFLADDAAGFRNLRNIVPSGSLRISLHEGVLSGFADAAFDFLNPAFAYAAGTTQPRATDIAGNNIPATGVHAALVVYNDDGTLLIP